ncbi:MAG TPA: hypothetical protein VJU61_19380, partial [Polyangiaceae bacterium]|nr:hypothetical protein [Polyangiaceae bacterium]
RLLESVWYLHSQPPLFNLWLGVVAKLFGPALPLAFGLSYLALGVALCVVLARLLARLGLGPGWSWAGAALFSVSPAVLLYEKFLFYSYPSALLVSASALLLHDALDRGRRRDWVLFWLVNVTLVLLRSLFHPLWLVAVWLGSLAASARTGQPLRWPLLVGGAAQVLVLALLLKNYVLFDSCSLSSWSGMNLARVVIDRAPAQLVRQLRSEGALSAFAEVGAFQPLPRYALAESWLAASGVPVLDRIQKRDGEPNFHHRAYLHVSSALRADALTLVRADPWGYLRSVRRNLAQTSRAASSYRPLAAQRARVAAEADAFERWLGWFPGLGATAAWFLIGLPLYALWRARRDSGPRATLLRYCALLIAYVVLVGALLERSENQRFRFLVDPLLFSLGWLAASRLVRDGQAAWRRRAGRAAAQSPCS